jgi:hypothetical protein
MHRAALIDTGPLLCYLSELPKCLFFKFSVVERLQSNVIAPKAYFPMSERSDLTPLVVNQLPWTPADYGESINVLADGVRTNAGESIQWYVKAKKPKRVGATVVRVLTILSTTAAGILTVLAQVFDGPPPNLHLPPIWISMALAISAALLGLDRFFGFARGWIRYVGTELKIRTALNEFNIGWPLRMVDWQDGKPDAAQTKEAITACKTFRAELDALVKQETDQWVLDFQASMKDIDEATKAAQVAVEAAAKTAQVAAEAKRKKAEESARKAEEDAKKPGALNVTVTNGDQCDSGWKLTVADRPAKNCMGKTAAVADLPPSQCVVRAEGSIAKEAKRGEKIVTVAAGTVGECSLTLE